MCRPFAVCPSCAKYRPFHATARARDLHHVDKRDIFLPRAWGHLHAGTVDFLSNEAVTTAIPGDENIMLSQCSTASEDLSDGPNRLPVTHHATLPTYPTEYGEQ